MAENLGEDPRNEIDETLDEIELDNLDELQAYEDESPDGSRLKRDADPKKKKKSKGKKPRKAGKKGKKIGRKNAKKSARKIKGKGKKGGKKPRKFGRKVVKNPSKRIHRRAEFAARDFTTTTISSTEIRLRLPLDQ